MTSVYKVHFANGPYPICGHPCWEGRSPITIFQADVTCKLCLRILESYKAQGKDKA